MNTGQIMLTIGAMVLLSLTTMRVNSHFVSSGVSLDETKFSVLAVSIASSVLEEANSKAFDETTTDGAVTDTTGLTLACNLESDSGETTSKLFDDCDDYNGYTDIVDKIPSASFDVRCEVNYVYPTTPDVNRNKRTWNKKITVYVTRHSDGGVACSDTIKMSSIFSYWYYR